MIGLGAPVFIGGLSHSGKTQLRVMLDRHPDLSLTRRTGLWRRHFDRHGDLARSDNAERCVAAIAADEHVEVLQPNVDRILAEFRQGPSSYARLFGVIHAQHARDLGRRRWGEQFGGVECFADPIFAAYPDARMIHLVRDPRSRYGRSGARGRRGSVGWDTARWLRSARLAERNGERYAGRYLVVRYETFASRPLATLRTVCVFLGETCRPEMERALGSVRFDQPLVPDESGGSAPVRPDVRRFVDTYAAHELASFEYPRTAPDGPFLDRVAFQLMDRPIERAAMTAFRLSVASGITKPKG